jgi:molybdate transport system substrate-binding protein
MNIKKLLVGITTASVVLAGCSNSGSDHKSKESSKKDSNNKQHITVSAAASLTDVNKDLAKAFKKDHKNTKISFNYGGSGALRQQIEKGAPSDVMMSANTKDVDMLVKDKKAKTYI